jgi:hypothetical protein
LLPIISEWTAPLFGAVNRKDVPFYLHAYVYEFAFVFYLHTYIHICVCICQDQAPILEVCSVSWHCHPIQGMEYRHIFKMKSFQTALPKL